MFVSFVFLVVYSLFCFMAGAFSVHFLYKKYARKGIKELDMLRTEQNKLKSRIEQFYEFMV